MLLSYDWSRYNSNYKLEVVVMPKKEPFWMSRRIWGAILTAGVAIYVVISPEQYDIAIVVGTALASVLGITSFVKPKK